MALVFPEFHKVYGNYYATGDQPVIPALWRSIWNAASTIGQLFSAFLTVSFVGYTERRPILYLAVVQAFSTAFALIFASNFPVLFVSKHLLGSSVGFSMATPPLYIRISQREFIKPTQLQSFTSTQRLMATKIN